MSYRSLAELLDVASFAAQGACPTARTAAAFGSRAARQRPDSNPLLMLSHRSFRRSRLEGVRL